jgi:hypothetical protein
MSVPVQLEQFAMALLHRVQVLLVMLRMKGKMHALQVTVPVSLLNKQAEQLAMMLVHLMQEMFR